MNKKLQHVGIALVAIASIVVLTACDRPHSEESTADDSAGEIPVVAQTAPIASAERASKLAGFATVIDPGPLLQLDADIAAANIAVDFSSGTLQRYRATKSLSRQTVETAAKQAGTDATQQKLLELRLRQRWGENAPVVDGEHRKAIVSDLSEGKRAIVRIDFPNITSGEPKDVRITPLSGGKGTSVTNLWVAPSGSLAMPGVSYYGLIDSGPGLRVGDRARATANASDIERGVIIPSSALVVSEGRTWCYVEVGPEKYEKRAVPLDHPFEDGYLVTSGFKEGEKIVVRGASLLLAREAEPADLDDDDDAPAKPRIKQPAEGTGGRDDRGAAGVRDGKISAQDDATAALAQRSDGRPHRGVDHD